MATQKSTADKLLGLVSEAGETRIRAMFGEYALYCDDKVVALVCDDHLYIKPAPGNAALLEDSWAAPPYPGSKDYFQIPAEYLEDSQWLSRLVRRTADTLPPSRPKKKRKT